MIGVIVTYGWYVVPERKPEVLKQDEYVFQSIRVIKKFFSTTWSTDMIRSDNVGLLQAKFESNYTPLNFLYSGWAFNLYDFFQGVKFTPQAGLKSI